MTGSQKEQTNPASNSHVARQDILGTIGSTPLVAMTNLNPSNNINLYAKLEGSNPTGSLKDRIALHMIEQAEAQGHLTPERIVLEPTSGNTGISLAMVCKLKGYRLKVVMPENVSPERSQLLRAYGAEIIFSDAAGGTNQAITVAQGIAQDDPELYYMPYQYGNEANPGAHYETTGREILEAVPQVDVFVAGLGTGGTLMGVGRRLKENNPHVKLVAVVPHPDDVVQGLRSLEEGFIPPIVDLGLLDSRIMVDSRDSFMGTQVLLEQEGIFAGISSGAVVIAALRMAQRMDKGNIVCLLADGGWKYLSTNLWVQSYEELEDKLKGKIWW